MGRTTDIRHALVAAISEVAPDARAFSGGAKYDGSDRAQFVVRVLVGDPEDEATVERLDEMLDETGDRSIKALLSAATDPVIGALRVVRHSGHRLFPVPGGGIVLGAEWTVD